MYKKAVYILLLLMLPVCAFGSDFASEVVSFKGPFGSSPYDDPNSVLGKPTTKIYSLSFEIFSCSLVYPAYNTDPNYNKLITTLGDGAEIVVKFDHKVADDAGNPYGIDFIVFGNSKFEAIGFVEFDTDIDEYFLRDPTSVFAEAVTISVAQHPNGPWYTFIDGPYGDANFPTNAFAWDRDANDWDEELNWLRPVDPNLAIGDFDGLSAADVIDLYNGSAGGTSFDLKDLEPNDYAALASDPDTGQKWIQYIKVQSSYNGEIDGFSDVAGGGDYRHPVGDLNVDCRVNYEDVALFCRYWLAEIGSPSEPAVIADIYEDDIVNFYDWALMAENWLQCSCECE